MQDCLVVLDDRRTPGHMYEKNRKKVNFFDRYFDREIEWYSSLWSCEDKDREEATLFYPIKRGPRENKESLVASNRSGSQKFH